MYSMVVAVCESPLRANLDLIVSLGSHCAGGRAYCSIALRADGTIRYWGSNAAGQSQPPADLGAVTAIAAGSIHTILLTTAPPCDADVNNDGSIDGSDLALLLAAWAS